MIQSWFICALVCILSCCVVKAFKTDEVTQPTKSAGGNSKKYDILIVGGGLSAAVLSDLYARLHDKKVLVIERRDHIAGNCFDYRDPESGVLISKYGAHLFHTNIVRVWKYVHRFGSWDKYEHRVVGLVDGKLVPIPVNIITVNTLFNETIQNVTSMRKWLASERAAFPNPKNSEEIALNRVGKRLYDKIFLEYTQKQWNVRPEALEPEVLSRIPVRDNFDDRYFPEDSYQALPSLGYTDWFQKVFNHYNIDVRLNENYFESEVRFFNFEKVFFTGQIDQYFKFLGHKIKPLTYRSIVFEKVMHKNTQLPSQASFVVNYPQYANGNFTRIVTYNHVYWQSELPSAVQVREYSTDQGEPYYPFPTPENIAAFQKYKVLAEEEELKKHIHFVGRLANYKYFDMDDSIENALSIYTRIEGDSKLNNLLNSVSIPEETKMITHIVIVTHGNASIHAQIEALCNSAFVIQHLELHFFVYWAQAKDADEVISKLCSKLKLKIHVSIARNVGVLPSNDFYWLKHMMYNSFPFGDANVYLSSEWQTDTNLVINGLKIIYSYLFLPGFFTRSSNKHIVNVNIQCLQGQLLPKSPPQNDWLFTYFNNMTLSFDDVLSVPFLHFIPLYEILWNYSSISPYTQKANYLLQSRNFFPTRSFIATDAGLRRMLAQHRGELFNEIMPKLHHSMSKKNRSKNITSHSVKMQPSLYWPKLFYKNC